MVAVTLPPLSGSTRLEENEELSEEISKPEGAVAVMFAVRLVPLTVKLWDAEALPAVAVKLPRLEGVAEMVEAGVEARVNSKAWMPWFVLMA